MSFVSINNNQTIPLINIPILEYEAFATEINALMIDPNNHCVQYFGYSVSNNTFQFFALIADDGAGDIKILSYQLDDPENMVVHSLSNAIPALHIFEREIHENIGLGFAGHPWLKPVRYAWNRIDKNKNLLNYPFYKLVGTESHEVGLGPIHAGLIEPGYFRFSCYGETIHHLEITHGYQHRGIENLFLTKKSLLQRTVLSESIAGDTVVSHAIAFVRNMEQLYGIEENEKLSLVRTIASELERIAIHVGNLSLVCQEIAYQLGSSVFGALKTYVIDYVQLWCGNRLSKGLIRTGYNSYQLSIELRKSLIKVLDEFEMKYVEMSDAMFRLPSVQSRLEKTGIVTKEQARLTGSVGLAAKITGIPRDIRTSHPYAYYKNVFYTPAIGKTGDAMAHAHIRDEEIKKSIRLIRYLVDDFEKHEHLDSETRPDLNKKKLAPSALSVSLTEGWRGEICHVAITDNNSELVKYKIKDPSLHNWFSLALALRENEISDFPLCNRSYDLSCCGYDL
ncbi:MAG: NADH-quinone oxidoreductase subunit C [Opitutaceae bacterium]|nr:NADH-quinone oxidoreductase subunit C [Cytophagales bacterium]